MKWTEKQQEAIDLRHQNMLVSAAAGSGKTAVLVERMKQLIMKDHVSIDHLLIVTFTNAAAAEMKEKIIRAITAQIRNDTGNSSFLRRQLDVIHNANISTFHSFALEIIRRYFYLIDIEPNFKIADEAEIQILKWDVIEHVFEDLFESDDIGFTEFLNAYSSDRSERALKENLLKIYETIRSVPDSFQWLNEQVSCLDTDWETLQSGPVMTFIREDIKTTFNGIIGGFEEAGQIAESAGLTGIYEKNLIDLEQIESIRSIIEQEEFDKIAKAISSFKATTMRASKEEKESYEAVKSDISSARDNSKKMLKTLKSKYFETSLKQYADDLVAVYPLACCLNSVLTEFDARYTVEKNKKNIIDFSDIEHLALKVLDCPGVAEEYKKKFEYIFVDEYQDSNLIQDKLIHMIKRQNNLFMVGDIKQSIYKFRLAEPEIFAEKYECYGNPQQTDSTKIDLNQNFRSKQSVIDTVNGLFSHIMEGYDQAAALYQGVAYNGPLHHQTELHVVDSSITETMDLDEEIAEMKNAQLEALATVEIIRTAIGTPIYDVKIGKERPLQKKDIVILMRGTKNYADVFQEIFTDQDLAVYVDNSSGYFDTVEIEVFLNMLRVLDNGKQDLPLLSILRSAMLNFSIEELIEIRLTNKKVPFYQTFANYSRRGANPLLQEKCSQALSRIDNWRRQAQGMPIEELLWQLMWQTGYYTYCGGLPGGEQRQANLRALVDKARAFQEINFSGIYGFLTYIEAIKERSIPMGQVKLIGENDDIIRIMTIHKSKGLEFPMVIVAGTGKKFNLEKVGKGIIAHKDLGLGMTFVNYQQHWYRKTIVQEAIERKIQKENIEEELRIFYVALTRAMDKLVLLGTSKKVENGEIQQSHSKNCFLDYTIPFVKEGKISYVLHDREALSEKFTQRSYEKNQIKEIIEGVGLEQHERDEALAETIDHRLSFIYENKEACHMKSKYSVTELGKQSLDYRNLELQLKSPEFSRGKQEFTSAELGTIMHKVMEYIDFQKAFDAVQRNEGIQYVEQIINNLVHKELLDQEEAKAVETERIAAFFRTDIGRRAAMAETVYKETEFNLLMDINQTEVMVQGVIDCYFEENEKLILVDYKNSYINKKDREGRLAQIQQAYQEQLNIYKQALETIKEKPVAETYLYLFSENDIIPC